MLSEWLDEVKETEPGRDDEWSDEGLRSEWMETERAPENKEVEILNPVIESPPVEEPDPLLSLEPMDPKEILSKISTGHMGPGDLHAQLAVKLGHLTSKELWANVSGSRNRSPS